MPGGIGPSGLIIHDERPGRSGTCVCQRCSIEVLHIRGIPCGQQKCPKCGSRLSPSGQHP